jgi:hypothetical protein
MLPTANNNRVKVQGVVQSLPHSFRSIHKGMVSCVIGLPTQVFPGNGLVFDPAWGLRPGHPVMSRKNRPSVMGVVKLTGMDSSACGFPDTEL